MTNGLASLKLQIDSVQLRQNLSREMHFRFGFDSFKVEFNLDLDDPDFTITKIKTVKDENPPPDFKKYAIPSKTKFVENPETGEISQINTKQEAIELESMIKHEVDSLFEYELGFSRVIELIINAKKPLVGHNLFLDIMFLYQQFIADLPDSLEEFVHNFSFYFPSVYDTKAMAEVLGFFNVTTLNAMSNKCISDKKFANYLQFDYDAQAGFTKYLSGAALHEAGYDSYITGIVFASLVKQLEI